jgi:alkylated DNA repair dioxygenase AlkB
VDIGRAWVSSPEAVFLRLQDSVAWQTSRLFRYDHLVEERRLGSSWAPGRPVPHPLLLDIHRHLRHRYRVPFPGFSMIQYRDGADGQGFHSDTDMRWLDDTLIVILTFGAQRPWLLRPKSARHSRAPAEEAIHDLAPVSGDVLVMGGRCQRDWEHAVPYLADRRAGPRISLQWRFARRSGRPFQGPGYNAPVHYSRRG